MTALARVRSSLAHWLALGLLAACSTVQNGTSNPLDVTVNAAPKGAASTLAGVPPAAPESGNLLKNPSFEAGRTAWWSFAGPERPNWADFSIATGRAQSGRSSARLDLTSEGYDEDSRIYGVVQDVSPKTFPRRLSGWYRVENWKRGAAKQYLQVVVVVWNAANFRRGKGNFQLSYVLAGISKPPFGLMNRSFEFIGPRDPVEGQWVRFERDLHADFQKHYGAVPEDFSSVRVLFEVRFDDRDRAEDADANAQVWYDDLYLGN